MEDFKKYFEEQLIPQLEEIEKDRLPLVRNYKKKVRIAFFIVLIFFVIVQLLIAGKVPLPPIVGVLFPISLVAAIIYTIVLRKNTPPKNFQVEFKNNILPKIVTYIDPSLTYEVDGMIPFEEFYKSELHRIRIHKYFGEDFVTGKMGATNIRFCEVLTQYAETANARKKNLFDTRTANTFLDASNFDKVEVATGIPKLFGENIMDRVGFQGIFIVLDFNKHFKTKVLIDHDIGLGVIGDALDQGRNKNFGEKVKLEDPEFEKIFDVWGSDQIEARYILSPALMQRIVEYKKKTKFDLRMSFIDSKVYMSISMSRGMFEPKFWKPVTDYQLVAGFLQYMSFIVSLVEDLNLNTRIWTKE